MICAPLGGPPTEYRPFKEFINYEGDIIHMKLFSNWLPALRRYCEVLGCMVTFVAISLCIDKDLLIDPSFKSESFWYKNFVLVASMHLKMYVMFVGFAAQEANLIATGMSYQKKSEK